jgi:transcriptional regulator with XRE-family HTH domain
MNKMNVFSQRLKTAMEQERMSQTALSKVTGLCKSSISQYVSGKSSPSAANLKVIASALNVSADYLKGGVDEPASDTGHLKNLPIETAAKLMGIGKQMLRQGLKNGDFPFGYAVKMPSGKYRYYISPSRFSDFTGVVI